MNAQKKDCAVTSGDGITHIHDILKERLVEIAEDYKDVESEAILGEIDVEYTIDADDLAAIKGDIKKQQYRQNGGI